MKICQLRPTLGDIMGNLKQALDEINRAKSEIIVFPELFLSGYPPTDDLFFDEINSDIDHAIDTLLEVSKKTHALIIIGTPFHDGTYWRNAALAIANGKIIHQHFKVCLPNYDIFNDSRYFVSGDSVQTFEWQGAIYSLLICEDIWADKNQYSRDPVLELRNKKIDTIFHLTASPFEIDKSNLRNEQLIRLVKNTGAAVISVNQVGGFNDILFDGQSIAMNSKGQITAQLQAFEEHVTHISFSKPVQKPTESMEETLLNAISFGLKEYLAHTGFNSVLIGLSGGIDSALVAALAVHALGPKHVTLVTMPSVYNSKATKEDAILMAQNLGCHLINQSIEAYRQQVESEMPSVLNETLSNITKQNIQSRLRGLILMTISNQLSALLLTTGNKSELAMGYATLYGDMNGGLNIIGDLFKTDVFRLARHLNRMYHWIPTSIIDRPPSAELALDQRDDDTLPPYDRLDQILKQRILDEYSLNKLMKMNDKQDVNLVLKRLKQNEFKRFQSPPILKLSSKSFGRGWQFPLVR